MKSRWEEKSKPKPNWTPHDNVHQMSCAHI